MIDTQLDSFRLNEWQLLILFEDQTAKYRDRKQLWRCVEEKKVGRDKEEDSPIRDKIT